MYLNKYRKQHTGVFITKPDECRNYEILIPHFP
jgi:hypothetical protein